MSVDDALGYLEQSEERQPTPPKGYSVTNRSMIGRIKLGKGQKAEARAWLMKAVELAEAVVEGGGLLDDAATEAAADARKALKKY